MVRHIDCQCPAYLWDLRTPPPLAVGKNILSPVADSASKLAKEYCSVQAGQNGAT
jgi:hypothetical protein